MDKSNLNTDKAVCRQLADLLVEHGVKQVFLSPGSRNAPLIVAIARQPQLRTTVVVDERSAAFMAMGYASVSCQPVALVCTSGTALLNYAPAVAEAYYRRLPLIVISADRPMEWIDQDDSQTLRQPGALSNYVKLSADLPEITTDNLLWYANRQINDAIIAAVTGRKAPVHINIQLDNPLGQVAECTAAKPRVIGLIEPHQRISEEQVGELAVIIEKSRQTMIICGFNSPNQVLDNALGKLSELPNVVIFTETISNLHNPRFISRIDTTLSAVDDSQLANLRPEIVITLGGALVSRFIKDYLRKFSPVQHWHVGVAHTTIDCFKALTLRVETDPCVFFSQIVQTVDTSHIESDYAQRWHDIASAAIAAHDRYIGSICWSDMQAFATLLPIIPKNWNLQLSNGTPIRYAQLFGDQQLHRSDCNRGVSGIDGCTSTAVGASMAYNDASTLLITGDMSAQYDVGALASVKYAPKLKIVVMCNGGGGIFRFIKTTASLDELDGYFAVGSTLPIEQLAAGYGIDYYEVHNSEELTEKFRLMAENDNKPAIMAVYTPPKESAKILQNYFTRKKQ